MSSFDGIADKFDKNIYGTTKGRLRHKILCHRLRDFLEGDLLHVVDVGGGTGVMALEFAQRGHRVVNTDISNDTLQIAKKRLHAYPLATLSEGSLFDWQGSADLIICHAVIEWLENPQEAVSHLLRQLKSAQYLSLSFFNYDAMLFSNVLYGNFNYIQKGMKVKNQVRLNPRNPIRPDTILSLINQNPEVALKSSAGIRCFHDYVADKNMRDSQFDDILELELKYADKAPYKYLGKYFHCLVEKL